MKADEQLLVTLVSILSKRVHQKEHGIESFSRGILSFKIDYANKFASGMNMESGFYIRTGVVDEEGEDTDVDPFMTSYPELIDVGIMHSCEHGRNGLCLQAGVQCYQDGLNKSGPNMLLDDFKSIVDQSKGKVFQIALGGRGDPNKHENFKEICEYCKENGIVPNYTTSGLNLTDYEVLTTKEFCGAVAVSWYRNEHTTNAINSFVEAGCKTNIHYVLGNNTIDEAINLIKTNGFPKGVNAVIFLMHKPVGLGTQKNVLKYDDPRVKEFFSLTDNVKLHHKVGFDSCSIPAIVSFTQNISEASVDTCEGGRWSCYCTADMKLLPCSFDQDLKWAVDLKTHTIQEAWDGEAFTDFRSKLHDSCPSCPKREMCMGGCPIKREIVLCESEHRKQT